MARLKGLCRACGPDGAHGSTIVPRGHAGVRASHASLILLSLVLVCLSGAASAQELPPELTRPVNDFAGVIDAESEAAIDGLIRSLQQASGDVVVVATVDTIEPYGDIREYAAKMFENRGRGIGQKGRDN